MDAVVDEGGVVPRADDADVAAFGAEASDQADGIGEGDGISGGNVVVHAFAHGAWDNASRTERKNLDHFSFCMREALKGQAGDEPALAVRVVFDDASGMRAPHAGDEASEVFDHSVNGGRGDADFIEKAF